MGHEHHHHQLHPHHQFYHQNLHIHHQRSTFLPMLCSRPSIKDVSLPRWRDRAASFSDDPLSPRIGCMGQVKRNNKIVGLPILHRLSFTTKSNTTTTNSTSPAVKYSKLKKLFSSKNLSTTTSVTVPAVSSCGSRRQVTGNGADHVARNSSCRNENCGSVSIDDMDPPLPVIKRVQKSDEERQVDSLWKRRSGGVALKSLQLQQIHQPGHHLLQPTSV